MFSSIDVVTKEKVVGFWWKTAIFEKSEKVVILSVNVTWSRPRSGKKMGPGIGGRTADFDGGLEFKENGLGNEDFARFCTEMFDFVLLKLYGLARSISAYCLKKLSRVESAGLLMSGWGSEQHHSGTIFSRNEKLATIK